MYSNNKKEPHLDRLHCFFLSAGSYELEVPENHKVNEKIGLLELEDRDEIRNKDPIFTIPDDIRKVFNIELTNNKDGNLMLKKVGGFFFYLTHHPIRWV